MSGYRRSITILVASSILSSMLAACASTATSAATATSAPAEPAATIGLPVPWTPTSTLTPAPTDTPTATFTPSTTPTPRPTRTTTLTASPVTPTTTPDLSTAAGVVEAAFAAHLEGDEETLEALYAENGKQICHIAFSSISTCISIAYHVQGLRELEEWWIEPPEEEEIIPNFELILLASRWRGSDKVWVQFFTMTKENGQWLIFEHATEVYPFDE